jgi:hypothetical protein
LSVASSALPARRACRAAAARWRRRAWAQLGGAGHGGWVWVEDALYRTNDSHADRLVRPICFVANEDQNFVTKMSIHAIRGDGMCHFFGSFSPINAKNQLDWKSVDLARSLLALARCSRDRFFNLKE